MIRRQSHRPAPPPRALNLALLVAKVCRYYPGEFQGGAIAAPLFFLLGEQLRAVLALEEVQLIDAVFLGQRAQFSEDMMPHIDNLRRTAGIDG